jgi:hypothetical protein
MLSAEEHANASPDPFRLVEDGITWVLRSSSGDLVELRFWATGPLGGSTKDLGDIIECRVSTAPDICLHFSKIKSDQWRDDLDQFVWSLQDHCRKTT